MRYTGNTDIMFNLSQAVRITPQSGTTSITVTSDGAFEMHAIAPASAGDGRGPDYTTVKIYDEGRGQVTARLKQSRGGMWRKVEIRLPAGRSGKYDFADAVYKLFEQGTFIVGMTGGQLPS